MGMHEEREDDGFGVYAFHNILWVNGHDEQ